MSLGTEFLIDYTNKRVYHDNGTTVYSVNALYSMLMDTFDELGQMDDTVPMSAQTPTAYTMTNSWFIDDESVKYLMGGAIETSGYLNNIQVITMHPETATPTYDNCVANDIGKMVTDDGGNTGNLLAYNNTTRKWWIRWGTQVAYGSIMDIPTGAGAGTAMAASSSGEDLFANVYTLGTVESVPAPQVYIFQGGSSIAEWSNLTNWDRGHIDVLIKVAEAGSELASGIITVFARQGGDLCDNFEIDLSDGGRNAVPLSTADDLNEDTGDYYLLYDAESSAFTTLGQIITDGTTGATAELVAATDWGASGLLKLRGKKGTFGDGNTITGSSNGSAAVNGTVGDTYIAYDAASANFSTLGQTTTGGTSGAKRLLRGIQQDVAAPGGTGKLVMQVDTAQTGTNKTAQYKAFSDNEAITGSSEGSALANGASTTIVAGFSDITIAFVNGTATHGGTTGTFTAGERVTYTGGEAIVLKDSSNTLTLGNVTNTALNGKTITGDKSTASCVANQNLQSAYTMTKAFEQQTAYPYAVIINGGNIYSAGRTLAQVYEYFKFITQENSTFQMYTVVGGVITSLDGEEYIQAYTGYVPSKSAPLGTFAGGKYFGAQGAWIEGMASNQSYQFTDADSSIRQPYQSITITVSSVVAGDRVSVFRTVAGAINETIFTSHNTANAAGDVDFVVIETIGTDNVDTPASGVIRAVDTSTNTRQRYRYASWVTSTFTFVTGATGTGTSGSSGLTLVDSTADFGGTDDVKVGDVIRNTTDGSSGVVMAVTNTTTLQTTLSGGSENDWDVSDAYDTNKLDRAYNNTDTAYVPFIDAEATSTSIFKEALYDENRDVLVRVRKKGILPFQTPGTVTTAGLSVAAIRTTDGIVQT